MLRVRLITAGILLPLVLSAFILGPSWFVISFVMLCMTLSIYEIAHMLVPTFENKLAHVTAEESYVFPAITVAIGWAMLLLCSNTDATASVGIIAVGCFAALVIGCFSSSSVEQATARACALLISLTYGALPWIVVWHLYLMGDNSRYPLFVMTVTWMGDTGGYFGGRFLGGKLFGDRKLAPSISPKKTWEGSFFGIVLSIVGGLVCNLCFLNELAPIKVVVLASFIGGMSAQVGDLIESMFKRFAGVKDSGHIFPGHGGFLDRVDGILFAAPVIWAILYYFK